MHKSGNTILLTGGGSGIGRGLAQALHRLGNQVIITGRNQSKLEGTQAECPGMQIRVLDMNDPAAIRQSAAELIREFPSLNVVIHNAGIMRAEDLREARLDDAEEMISTNLLGPIRLTAALLPHLMARPHATIANVTSGLAFVPMPATATYCATKAALHSYTQSLRRQLRETSVEVLEIVPPYVQTHLTGPAQAEDPRAMPLDEYLQETMDLLTGDETPAEILVERVKRQRFAERQGQADEVFAFLCELSEDRDFARPD
ncbi:MAG: SDR family oxidoreductase [Planctomycetota bacterium]